MRNLILKILAGIVGVCAVLLVAKTSSAEDWLQFRGENADGRYSGDVPTQWSDDQNLKWVFALPGKGSAVRSS